MPRYQQLKAQLTRQIQQGVYAVGELLPSEHELCDTYQITRTTVRKALDELQREGFILRQQGRGSVVCERRKQLGLLTVRGFSEAVGQSVRNRFIARPSLVDWERDFPFTPAEKELGSPCIRFSRLRSVGEQPVMYEESWLASTIVPSFLDLEFIEGSFFKTLSQRYLIEVLSSEYELHAIPAREPEATALGIAIGEPVLYIALRYATSLPHYFIYSKLWCDTNRYPVGNSYPQGR